MFFLIPLLLVSIAEGATQYPALPNLNLTLPTLNRSTLVVITGGKYDEFQSIANAAALIYWQQGATVAITTRNLKTFDYKSIANTSIKVYCLRLGDHSCKCDCRAYKFAQLIRERYGKNPDIYVNGALTIHNGDPLDYTSHELDNIFREYYTDPLEIERVFLENNNPNQQMKFLYIITWAGALVLPPFYQTLYNERARFLLDRLEAQNAALRFPNVEWLATLCVFTNTSAMITSTNPSATRAGLCSQQKFQSIFTANLYNLGYPPSFVGLSVVQATLLRAQLNYETIFDASGVYSSNIPAFLQLRITASGKQFTAAYQLISLNSYGINITQQSCPIFYIKPEMAEHVNNMIKYGFLAITPNIVNDINKIIGGNKISGFADKY